MEARRPDRYAWPAVDEEAVEVTCARIARHLARAATKIIGLLPAARFPGDDGTRGAPGLAPLLASLAGSLARFLDQDIAIIEHWRTWPRSGGGRAGASRDGGDTAKPAAGRLREVRPRVIEISPLPCDDAIAAGVALQNTLRMTRKEFGAVLIDLGGYAAAGTSPATLELCDGIVLVVPARRTRIAAVSALSAHVPSAKRLGAILLGSRS
ncbi:MAG TPA: hypothetical protein VFH68_12085 [Polyangia bacterium]|nr:hypothetical protein [Polyangia bacterium]